jgi:hypothetical protein
MACTLVAAPSYAEKPSATPASEQPDMVSALTAAKKLGKNVKITGQTTERSEYFATPDGKVTGVIAAAPVRFNRNGAWVPTDLTLLRQPDGSVVPAAHPYNLRISGARNAGDTGSADLASLGSDAEKLTMGWQGRLPAPQLEGNKATYSEVRPGVDLVIQATATGFEQFTVLKHRAAARYAGEIDLPLTGPAAASVTEDTLGRLDVRNAGGQRKASIPTPMMWDSTPAGDKKAPPRRRQVTLDVARTSPATPATLKLKPSQDWLLDPSTVYPVTIDPYFDWSTTATSTTVVKGYPTDWPDADSLFVGTYDANWSSRSFVTWWANALAGMHIDSAKARFANPFSSSCAPTPFEIWSTGPITDDMSWDNQPEWQHQENTAAEMDASYDSEHNVTYCDDDWITADATSFFQRAATNNIPTPTMGLRAPDETDYSQYKQFWSHNYSDPAKFPYVEVTYSQALPYTSDAFSRLHAHNPEVTAAELDASIHTAMGYSGLSYEQAIMTALAEADRNAANGAESGASTASTSTVSGSDGRVTAAGSDPGNSTCYKRDLGVARYRGDVYYARSVLARFINHGHVGIYYDTNIVIEARGEGINSVFAPVAGRQYCRTIEKMDVDVSISTQIKAADYAYKNLTGRAYDGNFAFNKDKSVTKLNCSELVWKAYKFGANIDLDKDGGTGVYPLDILWSNRTRTYQTIS